MRRAGTDWTYDAERYAEVTALRRSEQAAMAAFGADGRCLMRALQEELDDPDPQDCGRCAVCVGPRFAEPPGPGAGARGQPAPALQAACVLEVKKMAPDEDGAMRKLADEVRAEEGRALARLGDGGWDPVVQAGRRAGRFDDELVDAAAEVVRTGLERERRALGCAVPSDRSGALVPDFARAARARRWVCRTRLPWSGAAERPPQREMANSQQQVANVRGAFARQRTRSPTARACSSTTCASAAGRSPCSPASCAATASRRSIRWRSLPRSSGRSIARQRVTTTLTRTETGRRPL